jgi:hypothetical protein
MEIRCFSCDWLSQCHRDIKMLEAGGNGAFILGPCSEYSYFRKKSEVPARATKVKACNPLVSHPYNVSFLMQKNN